MATKTLCLIPARGGSKRVPRKNMRNLAGKPLIAYTIEAALDSGAFDRIVVSTEDDEIAECAINYGANVPFKRPDDLASDEAQVVDVVEHALDYFVGQQVSYERIAVLLPTTPLRTANDLKMAHEKFESESRAEFLMCVTDYRYSPFEALHETDGFLKNYWDTCYLEKRSQERPELVVDNGAAYIMEVDAFERECTFYGSRLIGYYMPQERSVDIDTPFDLKFAEHLLRQ